MSKPGVKAAPGVKSILGECNVEKAYYRPFVTRAQKQQMNAELSKLAELHRKKGVIQFEKPLVMPDQGSRPVYYASKSELEAAIIAKYPLIRMEPVQTPVNKNLKMQQQKTANLKTKT